MGDENSGEGDDGEAGARRFMVVPPHGGEGVGGFEGMGEQGSCFHMPRDKKHGDTCPVPPRCPLYTEGILSAYSKTNELLVTSILILAVPFPLVWL